LELFLTVVLIKDRCYIMTKC